MSDHQHSKAMTDFDSYDVDLPLDVDDEYWETEDPTKAFKQPPGVPSKMAAFICYIKLGWIVSFTLKTLYAADKSASFVPRTPNRLEQMLEHIESALDDWLKSLPEHLRWCDNMEDSALASQCAYINLTYHVVRIVVYRPFIMRPSNDSPEHSSPSVTRKAMMAGTASARAIIRLIKAQSSFSIVSVPSVLHTSFYAAGQMLLRIWDIKAKEKEKKDRRNVLGQFVDAGNENDSLTKEIDELVVGVRTVIDLYENVKTRWDFVQPILVRLKESLPKDGEMPQPDMWYQPIYQHIHDNGTSQTQDLFPFLPSDSSSGQLSDAQDQQLFSLYPSANMFQYPTIASNLPHISSVLETQTPKDYFYESIVPQSVSVGKPGLSTQGGTGYSVLEAQEPWSVYTSQSAPTDALETESHALAMWPHLSRGSGPEIDSHPGTMAFNSVSYGTSEPLLVASSSMVPTGHPVEDPINSERTLRSAEPPRTSLTAVPANNRQASTPKYAGNAYSSSSLAGQSHRNMERQSKAKVSATPRYIDRYSTQSALRRIPSHEDWDIDEPSPFVNIDRGSTFYSKGYPQDNAHSTSQTFTSDLM